METPDERADRHLDELLQELRVAQTGVQILFAFLLTIPFQQRFATVVDGGYLRWVYLATLVATALATAFLIGPVSQHRILFRQGRKPSLVAASDRLAKSGLVCLALAVLGSVFLVVAVVAGPATAGWVVVPLAAVFLVTWLLQPLRLRLRHGTDSGQPARSARQRGSAPG